MATGQCVTLPTLTRTDEEIVGTRTVETEVLTTTTAPPTFITSTISTNICTTNTTSPISSSCTPTFITTIETVPGETTVLTLTTSVESPITSSITTTLFTTSCTTPNNNNNDTPTPTPTPDPNTSPTITTTSTSSTTLPNGSISVSTYTLTTNTPPAPTTQSDGSSSNSDGPNVGAIAGGVVGGFVGLLALAMISWYFYKKSTSGFDRVFNNPDDFEPSHNQQDKLGPLDDEVQGKGYQYGLVGNEIGNGAGGNGVNASGHAGNGNGMGTFTGGQEQLGGFQGPSRANEMGYQPSGNETGYQPGGNDTGYQSDMGHGRTHSLAPLLGAVGGAATGAAVYAAASTANRDNNNNGGSRPGSSGRPSTGGSSKPLITPGPSPQAYGPQQGYGTQTYPPQSQGYSRTSYYGSSDHNHTATAYNPSLNTNPSVGSSSWGGGSSSSYAAPQPHVGMMAPLVAGAAPLAMNRPQSFDQDGRSGSPVSIQEQRVLQVINPDAGLASSPPQGASALASPTSPIGGSSSGHRTNPSVDGKGRPIDTRGQFVPIVHLDGGAYEEPPRNAVAGRSDGPLPPAYSS